MYLKLGERKPYCFLRDSRRIRTTIHLDSIRGCISVFRRQGIGTVLEALFFTAENVIVLKTGEGGELQGP